MKTRKRRNPPTLDVVDLMGSEWKEAFALLDICGEEAEKYANVGSALWGSLSPSNAFYLKHRDLYRSHVCELLARAEAAERIDTMTNAEILIDLVEASLRTPLNQIGRAIYHHLFRLCLGEVIYRDTFAAVPPPRERWEGQVEEELSALRRRVSPHRRIAKAEHRPRRKWA